MTEIKNASAATDAQSNIQQNYSTEKLINQKVLGKSIMSELAEWDAIGLHLMRFEGNMDVFDDRSLEYIHGQGEGILKVVEGIDKIISRLIEDEQWRAKRENEASNNANV
ncbi:hypothetical protein [Negativicoccus succinicivorans]